MKVEHVELVILASDAFFGVLSFAALLYARKAAQALARVAGVQVSDEELKHLEQYVRIAIAYVEERAHKYFRGMADDAPQTAAEKQSEAVKVARELAPDGLQRYSDEKVAIVVDAKVQEMRAAQPPLAVTSVASILPPPLPPPRGLS